jgi:hypothetical protein
MPFSRRKPIRAAVEKTPLLALSARIMVFSSFRHSRRKNFTLLWDGPIKRHRRYKNHHARRPRKIPGQAGPERL